jgi:hypothetical protein
MDVPKRIVDVFVAAADSVVNTSGAEGGCTIHICRTPAASAEAIVFVAAAAFAPSTISPTRSRVVGSSRLGETWKPKSSFVIFPPPPVLFVYPFPKLLHE